MTETEKKNLEREWIKSYTMTPEQVKQLLQVKLERAKINQMMANKVIC